MLPLDRRFRRMNLFDVRGDAVEGIGYVEEILEAGMNITEKTDKATYTPLAVSLLKTDDFTGEDVAGAKVVVCRTILDAGRLRRYLERFFGRFSVEEEDGCLVRFDSLRHAAQCLSLSNEDFLFLRPERYVQVPGCPNVFDGSKYCTNVSVSVDRIILGPLDVDSCVLRDRLDEMSRLQSFRQCGNPMYFVFAFLDKDFAEAFVSATSHVFISDCSQALVSERAYRRCSILDFGRNLPELVPRRMSGPLALSRERTRIVVLMNVLGPWDDVGDVVDVVREQSREYGEAKNIAVSRPGTGCTRIFIECGDLDTSLRMYLGFGGLAFENRIVAAGYYPETCHVAGEYE